MEFEELKQKDILKLIWKKADTLTFESVFGDNSNDKINPGLDYTFFLELMNVAGEELKSVPGRMRDFNMCLTAAKNNKAALKYIPDEFLKSVIFELMEDQNSNCIEITF